MKYAIDQIIDNIATLENIETGEKIELNINSLPNPLAEGTILVYQNQTFKIDKQEEITRRNIIAERFKKLQNTNKN